MESKVPRTSLGMETAKTQSLRDGRGFTGLQSYPCREVGKAVSSILNRTFSACNFPEPEQAFSEWCKVFNTIAIQLCIKKVLLC